MTEIGIVAIEILAVLCAGSFFGAALYINLVQHPATIATGGAFAQKFFPPMYIRASIMQIMLAFIGTIMGLAAWFFSDTIYWLIGSLFLASVIPITLLFIKSINDQLLLADEPLEADQVIALLKKWNPRHGFRTIASFIAFLYFLLSIMG